MDLPVDVLAVLAMGLPWISAGVLIGVLAGALPGFGGSNTLILLLPLTLFLDADAAILFAVGLFVGVRFGGAIPAVLINVPGTASGAVTAFEGYPLYQQGRANFALGVALLASVVGSFASGLIALVSAPWIAVVALKFSAPEIFALAIFSIVMVGQVSCDDPLKGWLSGAAGLLIGSVGVDPMWGIERGTFGRPELYDGVPVIPALVGLYGLAEVLYRIERNQETELVSSRYQRQTLKARIDEVRQGWWFVLRRPIDLLRSTGIGSFVGLLPGVGANLASFLSYQQASMFARDQADRKLFGQGNARGIIGSEAADNASASGALVPMMTLGIPGSASTAVLLLMMTLHGVHVGPAIFVDTPVLAYAILGAIPLAAICLLVIGCASIFLMTRIVLIPMGILAPAITVFALAGAFAARHLLFDLYLALAFGLIGYVMRKEGYPYQVLLIGIILAPVAETNFFIGLRQGFGSPLIFVERPLAAAIWVVMLISIAFLTLRRRRDRERVQ